MRSPRTRSPLVLAAAVLLVVAACSRGSAGASIGASPGGAAIASPSAVIDGIVVTDAWVRPPMGPDRPAAGYLTITNTSTQEDALIGVSSPIATSVEIHETMADDSGMMGMQPVTSLRIPGSLAIVKLEPGGYHLMLIGVADMPAVGENVELTLTFEHIGDLVVQAEVRAG